MDRQSTGYETDEERYFDPDLRTHGEYKRIESASTFLEDELTEIQILIPIYFMWQVIIQSLRESGVFSSVIASALQEIYSKEEFLSSVESSNSSRTSISGVYSSRKIGNKDSEATVRRILEFSDDYVHSMAVPPLSPPCSDDF